MFVSIKAIIKGICLALMALLVTVLQLSYFTLFFWQKNKAYWIFPSLFHKVACFVIGLKIDIEGEDARKNNPDAAILYASNHTSYVDIVAIGSRLKGMFVAKSDIAGWPIFGFLAKLQGTIFVERRPNAARKQKEMLSEFVKDGYNLTIFPEGTTSLGVDVLPFKSSLFGAFIETSEDNDIYVQPVCLTYTHLDGKALDAQTRELVSWYREEDSLIPHLSRFLKHGKMRAKLSYMPPIKLSKDLSRKEIASQTFAIIREKNSSQLRLPAQ